MNDHISLFYLYGAARQVCPKRMHPGALIRLIRRSSVVSPLPDPERPSVGAIWISIDDGRSEVYNYRTLILQFEISTQINVPE